MQLGGRDYRLLLAMRLLRGFVFGFSPVIIGIHLQGHGFSGFQVGLIITLALLSASAAGLGVAWISNRVGRKGTLAMVGGLMVVSGIALSFGSSLWLVILAALTGMMGAGGTDLGPFLPVEQAILTQSVSPERRNLAFGRYSLAGALASAAGSLLAAVGTDDMRRILLFLLFAAVGAVTAILALSLSTKIEASIPEARFLTSGPVVPLAGLIALDAFGSGLVTTSVLAFWLHVRFGAGLEVLGPAFAAMSLVVAGSYEIAARLGNRFGLVNTMVFTHLPSNLILFLVALSPTLPIAIAWLLIRNAMSQMDVPVRQAYIASVVPESQRSAALGMTAAVRGVAQACGPVVSGAAIQVARFSIPLIAGGTVKSIYDIGLYLGYRRRPAEHERPARP
jgi:MFS family permease